MNKWYLIPSLISVPSSFASTYFAINGIELLHLSNSFVAISIILFNILSFLSSIVGSKIENSGHNREIFLLSSLMCLIPIIIALLYKSEITYLTAITTIAFFSTLASIALSFSILENMDEDEAIFALKVTKLAGGVSGSLASMFAGLIASFPITMLSIMFAIIFFSFNIPKGILNYRSFILFNNFLKRADRASFYALFSSPLVSIEGLSRISSGKRVFGFILANRFLFATSSGLFFSVIPPFLLRTSSSDITYIALGLNSLSSSLGYLLARRVSAKAMNLAIILRSFVILSVPFLWTQSYLLGTIALMVMGIMWSIYDNSITYYSASNAPQGLYAIFSGVFDIGEILGALIGGFLILNTYISIIISFSFLLASFITGLIISKLLI